MKKIIITMIVLITILTIITFRFFDSQSMKLGQGSLFDDMLYIDTNLHRLGINTDWPTQTLDINGNLNITNGATTTNFAILEAKNCDTIDTDSNGTLICGTDSTALDSYTLGVQALTSSPVDGATVYFGNLPKAPVGSANISNVYIPKDGTITRTEIWTYSGTAGTAEAWGLYIRLNNSLDTLIATTTLATNARRFSNTALNIPVVAGNYIEIKTIQPVWATNPLTTIYGGYLQIK